MVRREPGNRIGFAHGFLRGQVIVLNFIYATCPDVCPLHAERIADIQAMINSTPMRDRVRFVSVTTDPENDTPQVLHDDGPAHGLDPANRVFLTSGPERPAATRRLAERYELRQAEDLGQGLDGGDPPAA